MKIVYYIFVVFCYLLSPLPLRLHYLIADIAYVLIYHVIRYRRRVVWQNLTSSFPEKDEAELRRIERRFYHFLCDYFVETLKLLSFSREELMRRMVFKGVEQIDEMMEQGRSCAVYLGHYGNWEWVSSLPFWVKSNGLCGQIYHPLENKDFDRFFLKLRQRMGAVSIPMNETLRKLMDYRAHQQPVVIGYISDQVPLWTNIHHWVDVLNHDTPVLTGAERIARKMNHAVFYMDVRRLRRGYYEVTVKLITRNPQESKEFELTDIYWRMLEETIREAPEYWLWSHNRWKRTREEFDRKFEVQNGKVVPKAASGSVSSAPYTAG
jgi:KDO2-lipid IV(A) lauroyltransferase